MKNKELPMCISIARKGRIHHELYIIIWNKLNKLLKNEIIKNI